MAISFCVEVDGLDYPFCPQEHRRRNRPTSASADERFKRANCAEGLPPICPGVYRPAVLPSEASGVCLPPQRPTLMPSASFAQPVAGLDGTVPDRYRWAETVRGARHGSAR